MRIVQINAVAYGSTGRIMFQLADALKEAGNEVLCTSGFTWKKCDREDFFITSNIIEKTIHTYLARVTGRIGCFSIFATARLLKRLDEFKPDIIHLHNLHCWFVNLPMLFDYIKQNHIQVVWTLHDCWSFTGHCPHFDGIGCEKWKTGCHTCPLHNAYPKSYVDASKQMYQLKKKWFTGVKDLVIVAPSCWLQQQVQNSFFKEYHVCVIHNGIALQTFHPMLSDDQKRLNEKEKHLILGVSYAWDEKKGLDVLNELANRLPTTYRIVLVGTDEKVERKLHPQIIPIRRTQNQEELARLYSAADVFVNPTREENYPTVNMEALACGTPVVTFNTGGSPEIPDETCGCVVPKNDVDALEQKIRWICEQKPFDQQACVQRAQAFDEKICIDAYMTLYRSMYDRTAANGN